MKKLIAIVLSAAMLIATSVTAFAVPADLSGVVTDLGKTPPITRSIDVPVDIKVDAGQSGTYEDGPVNEIVSGGTIGANYQATIYMSGVRSLFSELYSMAYALVDSPDSPHLLTKLQNSKVTGSFTIKISYPESAVIPDSVLTGTALAGFNAAAATTFEETVPRTVTAGAAGTKDLTITISVKSGILAGAMNAATDTYLPNVTFTVEGVTLSDAVNTVKGTITGQTMIYDDNEDPTPDALICEINYTGKQGTDAEFDSSPVISEVVTLTPPSSPRPSSPSEPDKVVEVVLPGIEDVDDIVISGKEKNPTVDIDELTEKLNPEREGFVFEGFYDDQYYTKKLSGEVEITEDTTIHGRWINVTVPEIFDADNHIQYIHGYPDETVRPESNVSREEIATMFYRLLKKEVREKLTTDANSFSDVESDRWSNNAVSTMANGGYIKGYADGTFRPEAYITRAELATIAYRFLDAAVTGEMNFNDIGGHWAEENIKSIANNAWIMGYRDGSFKPDEYITRAEAITIINRIVVRYVNEHGLIGDEKQWIDNPADAWYYYAVVEATHEHDHERAEDKYNELWNKSDSGMLVD